MPNPDPTSASGNERSPLQRPAAQRRIFLALLAACVVVLLSELLLHKHGDFAFEEAFGFHALFGFVAYLAIVNLAKLLRRLVERPEDYYDR